MLSSTSINGSPFCFVTYASLPVPPVTIGAQCCTYCAFLPFLKYVLPLFKHTHKPCKERSVETTLLYVVSLSTTQHTYTFKSLGGTIIKFPYPISLEFDPQKLLSSWQRPALLCQASGVKNLDYVHDQIKVKAIWQVDLGLEADKLLLTLLLSGSLKWISFG